MDIQELHQNLSVHFAAKKPDEIMGEITEACSIYFPDGLRWWDEDDGYYVLASGIENVTIRKMYIRELRWDVITIAMKQLERQIQKNKTHPE